MSGDDIKYLKPGQSSSDPEDLEYAKKILHPFDNINKEPIVENFQMSATQQKSTTSNVFTLVAILLVLFLTFPSVKQSMKMNEYILWSICAIILLGSVY
jgi:glycerate-2-kinase